MDQHFDDLLTANRSYAETFDLQGFDGIAKAGVMLVTCMDSRIEPLGMLGLKPGDAKILRNPGGRVDDRALVALVLGNNLLNVDRILIVEHTRCAVASNDEETILTRIGEAAGQDAHWLPVDPIADQRRALAEDVHKVASHPLIADAVHVGGFLYDVDTGLLERVA